MVLWSAQSGQVRVTADADSPILPHNNDEEKHTADADSSIPQLEDEDEMPEVFSIFDQTLFKSRDDDRIYPCPPLGELNIDDIHPNFTNNNNNIEVDTPSYPLTFDDVNNDEMLTERRRIRCKT